MRRGTKIIFFLFAVGTVSAAWCMNSEQPSVEMLDGHAILPLPVHDFEKLPLRDKLVAYHLYQAAVAGRDINFDQNHHHNLAIRNLCEEILLHSEGIDRPVLEDIAHYLKLQYINTGIHGKMTFAKFLPPKRLTFNQLKQAAEKAAVNGAKFAVTAGSSL